MKTFILSQLESGSNVRQLSGRSLASSPAVDLTIDLRRKHIGQRLDRFLSELSDLLPDRTVSCSIGACQFVFPQNVTAMLEKTDATLYMANEKGRACYVVSPL